MSHQQVSRINDVLFYIHQDISRDLSAKELADVAAYSEQHFHRIFKDVVGESIHQYIRRTRMEYAANQLMFDIGSSVLDIANKCGFNSVSSFSRAFKATFAMSPGAWRKHDLQVAEKPYLKDPEVAAGYHRVAKRELPEPKIIEVPQRFAAYVRHEGYNRSIRNAWLILKAWASSENRDFSVQYGLHHSNPAWVELDKCRYVACMAIDKPLKVRGVVNQMTIPGGLHAVFRLTGVYGELLPQLSMVLEKWLPNSGFKQRSTPAYVHYHKNHFLSHDEAFELDFYLPISFF
ncbi:AraC family transcriptional regulator [Vibrio parahaemolyticus]|uniref:AraC family transcriptional regulator n=1 Tax=Vibrio parahaemolyticus TaxID=670 RepID=A0AAW3IYJ8_VIBPH|nr:helix-turn-helix domain-containing protein [Vibrio parahaemolyticus]EGQ9190092.1 AraC family transcriptional regulator [Vibrio parahaemolyticus]EIF8958910.1 AraC family transcriptional regulator [Vibrio parahaemolyticus]EJG1723758.1 AraC family transcriptional regulator [Vibrio parahaemolyticus]EJG1736399.1 AraC family transcriptional regulator [Vibrio parahaemolyticus]EJG1751262.1 AraC family transcriptional regulator [Vibrio parahaemolyticus]